MSVNKVILILILFFLNINYSYAGIIGIAASTGKGKKQQQHFGILKMECIYKKSFSFPTECKNKKVVCYIKDKYIINCIKLENINK